MVTDRDLWNRLATHDFDAAPAGDGGGWFIARLARDNGWSHAHTLRVLEEYRRYAYLTCTAGHVVVPSEQVDQAWHQHLLDTEPYWMFCRQVLGRSLHHRPSKGGLNDRRRHVALYQRTLASYEKTFGHRAPADIWPEPSRRFGRDLRQRRVNLHDYWLIPRRSLKLAAGVVLALIGSAAVAGAGPRLAGTGNPFDMDGPSFLVFYTASFVVLLGISLVLRARIRGTMWGGRSAFGESTGDELDVYEAATLQTNTRAAINAAMVALERDGVQEIGKVREKGLIFAKTLYRVTARGPLPADALPLERAVYDAVTEQAGGRSISDVHERVKTPAAAIVASLQNRGLMMGPGSGGHRLLAATPLLLLAVAGGAKVAVGLMRDRPVVFLVILTFLTLIAAVLVYGGNRRTQQGSAALKRAAASVPKKQKVGPEDVSSGRELAWLVALYGVTVLHGGPMVEVHAALTADAARGGGGGAGTGGGGCGGGCGGGGCGGGCGGCGD